MDSKKETAQEEPLKKIYFNIYVAGVLRNRPDMEAINTDLLYFCLLMKMNQYAKEVYFLRKTKVEAAQKDAHGVYKHLQLMRAFTLQFYEIDAPRWNLIQDELNDPIEELDKLEVQEDPFGDKTLLSKLKQNSVEENLSSSLEGLKISDPYEAEFESQEEDDGEMSPRRLVRTPSIVPHAEM